MAKEIVVENIIKDEIVIEKNTKQQVQIESAKNDQVVVEEKNSSGTIINEDGARIVNNYDSLKNKPKINGKELVGDISSEELGIEIHVEVPTKLSELENDSDFATKEYVDNEIATFDFIKIVPVLPEKGLPNKTYLVPKTKTTKNDLYDEYIWVNKNTEEEPNWDWEFLGTKVIEVDLTNYYTKDEINQVKKAIEEEIPKVVPLDEYDSGESYDDKTVVSAETFSTLVQILEPLLEYGVPRILGLENYDSEEQYDDNVIANANVLNYFVDEFEQTINEVKQQKAIPELVNQKINITALDQGIYMVSGTSTQIMRGSVNLVTKPIPTPDAKGILVLLKYASSAEQGFFIQASSNAGLNLWIFKGPNTTQKTMYNLLTTNNTLSFTPTQAYHPTSKLYVDSKFIEVKYGTFLDEIDLTEYDDDASIFMETLTEPGLYYFTDNIDNFTWVVEVKNRGDYCIEQEFTNSEELHLYKNYRMGWYNEDEDLYEWSEWKDYLSYAQGAALFALKAHAHFSSYRVSDLHAWLDTFTEFSKRDMEVIQTSNEHKFKVYQHFYGYTFEGLKRNIVYQEYFDLEEPSKIYKRMGLASGPYASATIEWEPWYIFDADKELEVIYTINPATMEAGDLSHSSKEIITAFNAGKKIYLKGLILGSVITICSTPEMIDGDYVFTYPLMRVNLGEGMQNYMFALTIYEKNVTIKVNKLINDDDIQNIYDEVNEFMSWFAELIVKEVEKQAKESAAAEIAKIENRLLPLNAPENAIMKVVNGEWTAVTETQEEENEV